jgi:hypothetical protein
MAEEGGGLADGSAQGATVGERIQVSGFKKS